MRIRWWISWLPICIVLAGCTQAVESRRVLKLAHGLDVSHPVHLAMDSMARHVARISAGALQVAVYPNEQLGTERQCLELLQLGSLDMTKVSAAVLENFAPNLQVLGLPYIFSDKTHYHHVADGPIGQALLDEGVQYWLKGLVFYDAGSRSFYTKDRPIRTPADLKGMKIRVMNSVTAMSMIREMGGSPTPISFGELYTALQQGVVDGAENNPPSFLTARHYEVCKYYSLDEHTSVPDVLLISTHSWARLAPQEQAWLLEAARASVPYQRHLWEQQEAEALAIVREAGVEVIYPEKQPFQASVDAILGSYNDQPGMRAYIQQIRDAMPAAAPDTLAR
ncbi:MAG: TRAP transporter substrate-binding protein [Bacteroidia bacterium]